MKCPSVGVDGPDGIDCARLRSLQISNKGERVGTTGRRVRKIMVVALARKLLIALWRFVTDGTVPEGAVLKPAA